MPAHSIISGSFALVASYLLTFLLRSCRAVLSIPRLANYWATIHEQTRFFSSLLHVAAIPLFSSGILHTHTDNAESLESHHTTIQCLC